MVESRVQVCGWFRDNRADIHRPRRVGQVVPKTHLQAQGSGAQACASGKRLSRLKFLNLSTASAALYYNDYLEILKIVWNT